LYYRINNFAGDFARATVYSLDVWRTDTEHMSENIIFHYFSEILNEKKLNNLTKYVSPFFVFVVDKFHCIVNLAKLTL